MPLLLLNTGANIGTPDQKFFNFLPIIPITIGISAVLGILGAICDKVIFTHREESPLPLTTVLAGFFFAGFGIGVASSYALERFDINVARGMFINGILGGIFLVWWGTMVTLLLDGRDRFSRTRDLLVENAVQIELALLQEAEVSELLRTSIRNEINMELTNAREAFAKRIEGGEFRIRPSEWTDIATSIRDTASNVIRPMSKRLQEKAEAIYPKPSLKTFFWNIIQFQQFRPGAFTLVYLLRTGPIEVQHFGILIGLISYAVATITIFITMQYSNYLMVKFPRVHAWIFVDAILIIQLLYLVLHLTREFYTGIQIPNQELFTNLIISVLLILVTSGFGTFRNIHQDMTTSFKSRVKESQIEVMAQSIQLSRLASEAAELLHGQVQTKLISCAAAIDQARASGNVEQFNRALLQARAILELPIQDRPIQLDSTIEREVARKCDLWNGLCEFNIYIDPHLLEEPGTLAHQVGSIIEEAISNAMRHGGATKIDITIIEVAPGNIFISVADNGIGPQGGVTGLGSEIISRYSNGSNTLAPNPSGPGSVLTLHLGRS